MGVLPRRCWRHLKPYLWPFVIGNTVLGVLFAGLAYFGAAPRPRRAAAQATRSRRPGTDAGLVRSGWEALVVMVGRLLVGVAGAEQRRLVERPAQELQADGQAAHEAAGHRQPGHAGQVGGHREDVGQVHLQRIVGLLAEPERRRRASWASRSRRTPRRPRSKSRRISVRTFCARR